MKYNVGILDRSIRFVLGAIIIAAGIYYQNWGGGGRSHPDINWFCRLVPGICGIQYR